MWIFFQLNLLPPYSPCSQGDKKGDSVSNNKCHQQINQSIYKFIEMEYVKALIKIRNNSLQ